MEGTTPARIRCYAFAPFIIDLGKRQLWRDGQQIPLTAKTFDVLAFLVGNRHRAVTKDEFFTHVWPDSIVLEANLFRQISLIRRALHQRPDEHDYIVTLPGKGYQFVADVTDLTTLPIELNHDPHGDDGVGQALPGSGEPHVHPELLAAAPQPTDSSGPRRRWLSVTLRGTAMTLAVLGITWYFLRPEPSESAAPTLRKFTFDSAFPREPTWSPDGRALAYTSDRSGNSDIWVQTLSDPTPVRVTTGEAQDWQPHWSPVADQIVFRSEADGGGLFIVAATGGTPRRLTNFGYRPRWSPDGKLILFSSPIVRSGPRWLFVTDTTGQAPKEVAAEWMKKLREAANANAVHANWSPDGQHLSLWGRFRPAEWSFLNVRLSDGTVEEIPVAASVWQRIKSQSLTLGNFQWSPTGSFLYFEGRQSDVRSLWRIGVDPETKAWVSGPDRLSLGTTDDVHLAISPDGTKAAFTSLTAQTRVWSQPFDSTTGRLTGSVEPVTSGNANDRDVDVSDDGRQLAYRTQRGEREEIWAYSLLDQRERLLLASTTARRTSPVWSPDGTELLYARRTPSGSGVDHSLAILRTSGGEERVVALRNKMGIDPRDWSNDGHVIVGQCRDDSMTGLGTCLVSLADRTRPAEVKMVAYRSGLEPLLSALFAE